MNVKGYQLRLRGLQEAKGQIKAGSLQRVLEALTKTAERSTRLLATGEGSGKGRKPAWLDAAIDFTVTGLESGSTVLGIDAPRLGNTAYDEFIHQRSSNEPPNPDDTALDLSALAIKDAQTRESAGDRFDGSVLEAILMFKKAAGAHARFELIATCAPREMFAVDDRVYARVEARLQSIAEPRAFVVAGRLDEIGHGDGRFRLTLSDNAQLPGRLDLASFTVETLRPLWGKKSTVAGIVHFKANGQPRFIEARRISARHDGDEVFEEIPSAEIAGADDLPTIQHRKNNATKPMDLLGTWPGVEPVEELLSQLD